MQYLDDGFYIDVPVNGLVKKYIVYKYKHLPRIEVTQKHIIGRMMYCLLCESKNLKHKGKPPQKGCIRFSISVHRGVYRTGFWLTSHAIKEFNAQVELMVRDAFYQAIDDMPAGMKLKDLIDDFRDKYDFTESDLTFDALKKSYQRYIHNLEIKAA